MFKLNQFLIMIVVTAFFTACNQQEVNNTPAPAKEDNLTKGRYIVTYNTNYSRINFNSQNYDNRTRTVLNYTQSLVQKYGVSSDKITQTYNQVFQGFAAELSAKQLKALEADPRVARIEPDGIVTVDAEVSTNKNARQFASWGGNLVGRANGAGKTVWVIDSGVDLFHSDLNVNRNKSRTFVAGTINANDDHGHGTHVAGIIGAKNNSFGTIGVAYGATIVAVKVLNSQNRGSWSDIIRGIDYTAANVKSGEVVNLSLGGNANQSVDNAVRNLANKGVLVAIAAGNGSRNVSNESPARVNHPNVVTVSSMDSNRNFASDSNFGAGIDFCAPGVNVRSTWKNGGYNTISGTSMATPHVAALMLLRGTRNLRIIGNVSNDPDGQADPIPAL